MTAEAVTLLNQAAVKFCGNDIIGAKESLDQLLISLDLKLTTV
jgi:hypothetical protein